MIAKLALALALASRGLILAQEAPKLRLLDGKPKTLVVNGYSTSFRWPKILERKLGRYFDGSSPVRVAPQRRRRGCDEALCVLAGDDPSAAVMSDSPEAAEQSRSPTR